VLTLVTIALLVWGPGSSFSVGARIAARPVAANGLPALGGPPAATPAERQHALTRLIERGDPIMCGGGTRPLVALTFDDGPGPYTAKVLHILKRQGARATFFIVAKEILDWPGLADMPRTESSIAAIGDHTYDHVDLVGISDAQLHHQVVDAKALIEQHAGTGVRLFRPPYGHHDPVVDHAVQRAGMLEVLWTVDSQDGANGVTAPQVLANVVAGLRPGAIVLLHENRGTTLQMLPRILDAIRDRGLRTVTIPELLAADPPAGPCT
jgi:peptidoglycan/xylan/chitin deacetylase (PgdA/CDA1 family)